jgi:hypothetical protein
VADSPAAEAETPFAIRSTASFRDPSGFVYSRGGVIYRQVQPSYRADFERLIESGLYAELTHRRLLIPHENVDHSLAFDTTAERVLRPERIPFISYPYEWCFSQLQDAALLTLDVHKAAIERGMTLKDASAFNVTVHRGRPIFLDTLSFEQRREGEPWQAYRQYCEHFLAPLALMAKRDLRLGRLLRVHLGGIPLDLAARMLPLSSWLRPSLLLHIRLHAATQRRYAGKPLERNHRAVTRRAMLGLIDSLRTATESLRPASGGEGWAAYYDETNYSEASFERKASLVRAYLQELRPQTVWDLGANTGVFSRIAAETASLVVSLDFDQQAVEANYRRLREEGRENICPLWLDLANPSEGLGWAGAERASLAERGPADTVLALALVHHLAIGNNTPLDAIAAFLARLGRSLIIEFVPKSDSQVQRLLASRQDIFGDYRKDAFEAAFGRHFEIRRSEIVAGSERTLYMMSRRQEAR